MTIIPIATAITVYNCPVCGPSRIVVPDSDADNCIVTCETCGRELGTWAVVQKAVKAKSEAAFKDAMPSIADALRKALRGS